MDQYAGFIDSDLKGDGLHPNSSGDSKMASKWADALVPLMKKRGCTETVTVTKPVKESSQCKARWKKEKCLGFPGCSWFLRKVSAGGKCKEKLECQSLKKGECMKFTHCLYHKQHQGTGVPMCLPLDSEDVICEGASQQNCLGTDACTWKKWSILSKKKRCYDNSFRPNVPDCGQWKTSKACRSFGDKKIRKVCAWMKDGNTRRRSCGVVDPEQYETLTKPCGPTPNEKC